MVVNKIPAFVVIIITFNFSVFAHTKEQLKENLLSKKKLTILDFNASLDSLSTRKWELNDSSVTYINWLYENKQSLLAVDNPYFKVHVFLELAHAKYAEGKENEACQFIDSTFQYFKMLFSPGAFIKINKFGASIANQRSYFKKSIEYYENILNLEQVNLDSTVLADVYLKLASYSQSNDQYDKSMYYSNKAYPVLQALDDKPAIIELLITMYNSAKLSSNDTTCIDYLYKAIDMAKIYGDSILISSAYENLGVANYRKLNYSEAIKYYKIARNYASDKGSKREVRIAVMQHLCYTYMPDSVERACEMSDYILKRSLINNDMQLLSNAYLSRANCFANHDKRDSAAYYLDKAEKNRFEYGNPGASSGFFNKMHEVSMKIEDYERALKYLELSNDENIRLRKESNSKQLSTARAELDYLLQKEEIEELNFTNQIQNERNKRQKITILGFIIIVVIGIVFFVFARNKYNQLQESYRELFKKNIEIDKLNLRLDQTEEKLQLNKNGNEYSNGIKDEEKIYQKLKYLLNTEKIYKQPDISVGKLAKKLKTNTSYLSVIINSRFEESFKTLINNYRINEARRLLRSSEYSNYSIEGIAEEVGYQSRSTFYQSFKQITGLTPTQYVKNITK